MPRTRQTVAQPAAVAAAQPLRIEYTLRGGNNDLFRSTEAECLLAGPAETGKTWVCALKAMTICQNYPGAQGLIVRKVKESLTSTVLVTMQRVLKPLIDANVVRAYGGESPTRFIFSNGSCIWTGGMDNADSVLSAERDFIMVNQAEGLDSDDWEYLTTRCTGRGSVLSGNKVQPPQLFGDANPAGKFHWILQRVKDGKLRMIESRHTDNPTLYSNMDGRYVITEQGERSLKTLANLSGANRDRLFRGLWVTSEGVIFDMFQSSIHVCERDPAEMVRWFLAMDDGYTNPAVVLLVGSDSDGRWHVFREYYHSGKAQPEVVKAAKVWWLEKTCEMAAVDEAAASLIAELTNQGLYAAPGKGRIIDGIYALQGRLKPVAGDVSPRWPGGRPRLTFSASCTSTLNELDSHVWKPGKDIPLDRDNHSVAALRYLHDVLTGGTGAFNPTSPVDTGPLPQQPGSRRSFQNTRHFTPRSY